MRVKAWVLKCLLFWSGANKSLANHTRSCPPVENVVHACYINSTCSPALCRRPRAGAPPRPMQERLANEAQQGRHEPRSASGTAARRAAARGIAGHEDGEGAGGAPGPPRRASPTVSARAAPCQRASLASGLGCTQKTVETAKLRGKRLAGLEAQRIE